MKVVLTRFAAKQLEQVPEYIHRKYLYWIDLIKTVGVREARKYKGFHDEPLSGNRSGQRSVRLSKSYRAIYREDIQVEVLEILEVSKHDY